MFIARKLENYLHKTSLRGAPDLIPHGAKHIKVFNVTKLGGGVSNKIYSFSIAYVNEGITQTKNLVLKMYPENEDPVMKMDLHNEDPGKCLREYQVLKSLERIGFSVPHVYVYESNCDFLGLPFIIMNKEEIKEKSINVLGQFATTLARLHNLRWMDLEIECLRPPQNEYEFAKRQITHFENLLNYLTNYDVMLKEDFNWVIHWLENNALMNPCDQYSLVHGDYCPGNVFLNKNLQMVVTDWEWADIGDPAYDVGVAYHYLEILTGAGNRNKSDVLAQNFIKKYTTELGRDISRRLEFYEVVAALKLLIFYKAVSLSPTLAYKYYGVKSILVFPLLQWFLRPWPQYLENFLKKKVKNL